MSFAALVEDLSSVPNTQVRWLTTDCNSSLRESMKYRPMLMAHS